MSSALTTEIIRQKRQGIEKQLLALSDDDFTEKVINLISSIRKQTTKSPWHKSY